MRCKYIKILVWSTEQDSLMQASVSTLWRNRLKNVCAKGDGCVRNQGLSLKIVFRGGHFQVHWRKIVIFPNESHPKPLKAIQRHRKTSQTIKSHQNTSKDTNRHHKTSKDIKSKRHRKISNDIEWHPMTSNDIYIWNKKVCSMFY